ncbi:PREDICTED: epithelial chloride channel protein-like [Nanorana parkeri]|uniref:epithelial chloride channel protein-like n=1 Tax=Nanorana parkeri TaxID=125878 RepID=UPI000854F5B5|nr:PREDICTED: epithelial chloride channel protein-like [Nanorana parkeri]
MNIGGILLLASVLQLSQSAKDSLVTVKNNGYEDMIFAINPKIPENEKIIENIKKMVNDASTYMLQATENRLYIRTYKILIPNTWTSKSTYGRPKRESYDKADIIIADPFTKGDFPYTLQYGGCGVPGKYIHLTPNFILNDKVLPIFGPRGRVLVHEWAHLRWGVFDEYSTTVPWYPSNTGKIEATRCPLSLKGEAKIDIYYGSQRKFVDCEIDENTGLFEENCNFFPIVEKNVHESIMYGQALDPVNAFCKHNTHNKEAPNEQNRLCNQQSTWEVIMNSDDIKSSAPLGDSSVPPPTITLLQYKDRVVTLVLDVSGSMSGSDRINRMYQAAEVYIMQIVETGSHVGIVTFSSSASILSDLVKIVDTFSREKLKGFLPTVATGGTNICSGVDKGLEANQKFDGSTYGTEIVLLTDGEDAGVSSCFPAVQASGAIIHTVALGNSADKGLEGLSNMTGGLKLYASDNVNTNGLIDSFSGIKSSSGDVQAQSIQIESTAKTMTPNQCLTGKVTIDGTVGSDTFFLVTWNMEAPKIQLTDPKGKVYQNAEFVIDTKSRFGRLSIPGTAEKGDWPYNICNTPSANQVLGITVNSRAADPNVPPITVESFLNADTSSFPTPIIVYATVTQGLSPVLGVKVTAYIEAEDGTVTPLQLLDNGAGADIIKNDGIYCRYFTSYTKNGRYSLKVRVQNFEKDSKLALANSRALYLPGYIENGTLIANPPKPNNTVENLNVEIFSRTSSGGAFVISDVPSGPIPDMHGPSKITDLEAEITDMKVILKWTATGDDLDQGNASRYDLRISRDSDELMANFENGTVVNISSLAPQPAGSMEYFELTPVNGTLKNGTVLFFRLVAIDKANHKSDPSNLARATMFIPSPPQPTKRPENSAIGVTGTLAIVILTLVTVIPVFHI